MVYGDAAPNEEMVIGVLKAAVLGVTFSVLLVKPHMCSYFFLSFSSMQFKIVTT
jgi:hypothetical protein